MADPASRTEPETAAADSQEASEVRYLPVPAVHTAVEGRPARPLERFGGEQLPATVVAATGGFIAAIASFVLVRVLRGRTPQRTPALALGGRRRGRRLKVEGSRSFLVDVHMLRR